MSSTSSPRSDWFSGSRNRRPSKAVPVTATTGDVEVVAQPSHGASPEGRAQSRQTLSRHLSQSQLGVESDAGRLASRDAGRLRSGSSVSVVDSNASDASSVHPARRYLDRSASPLSTPYGSPSAPRRRSSAGPSAIPRSTSWYQTTSRKGSLAVPALSTIEGSIADLQVGSDVGERKPDENTFFTSNGAPTDSSSSMKRSRTSQGLANPKEPKRQATDEGSAAQYTKEVSIPLQVAVDKPSSPPATSDTATTAGLPAPPLQAEANEATNATVKTWRSYITLTRSAKPQPSLPDIACPVARDVGAIPHDQVLPIDSGISAEMPVELNAATMPPSTSPEAPTTTVRPEPVSKPTTSPPLAESKPSTKLDLKAFAAGNGASPSSSKAPSIQECRQEDNSISRNRDAILRAQPSSSARPTSWWGWTAHTPVLNDPDTSSSIKTSDEPFAQDSQSIDVTVVAQEFEAATSQGKSDDVENTTNKSEEPALPSDIISQPDGTTWSAWLGSYLAKPVQTTSVTYGAGIAPSITSSVASSTVPDADETSPPPPMEPELSPEPIHMTSSPTLQRINPLLDVMPRSTWSSFFASRILPTQKTIDNKPATKEQGDVETMEIDFGSLAPSEIVGDSVVIVTNQVSTSMSNTASNRSGQSTSKATASSGASSSDAGQASQASSESTIKLSAIKPLTKDKKAKGSATSSSSKTKRPASPKPSKPNLVLPTFEDTFERPPRSLPPARPSVASPAGLKKAVTASLSYLFSGSNARAPTGTSSDHHASLKGKEREIIGDEHERLPKAHTVAGSTIDLQNSGRIAVIGVHGWFIQTYLKNVVGEPTGTSTKFASMMKASVKGYYAEMGHPLNDQAVTAIPLEGDGTVKDRAERLYENLMARQDWIEALNNADRIFVASHSQGTIVSTMLIERLINEGEINGTKCMMLNMCSVSQGPFYSLYNSWTVPAYLYFETAAATELFEFQKPHSAVSKAYVESLQHILNAGVKILFVASLNDQVVPLYSALFSSLSHPNILRTIFIDSSVFETSADFMTNLVVFSTRLRNAGVNCHGLDFHLSEALMGSLVGVGHSTVYEEPMVYKYAVRYLLETTSPLLHGTNAPAETDEVFQMEDFNPRAPANPYYLPWALRGIIEDQQIRALFADELQTLRDQFEVWQPKTKALQQVQAALEPLRLIPRTAKSESEFEGAVSKTDKKATAKL